MNKVQKGEKFAVKAATWNSFIEAAEFVRDHRQNEGAACINSGVHPGIILLKNGESVQVEQYAAMVISDVLVNPAEGNYELPGFVGRFAVTATKDSPFAVTLEPIAPGEIGRAMLLGVTPAKVTISDTSHQYAAPVPGSTSGTLQSAANGTARILWKAGSSGTVSCMLQLGGAGSGETASSTATLCCVQNGTAESGFSVSLYGNGRFGDITGYGWLFVTELALATSLPSGSWVMGFPTDNPATGGNES